MMKHRARKYSGAVAIFLIAGLFVGCDGPPPASQPALPSTKMEIGSRLFTLEIAKTESARQTGLMNRDSMPADHGMIFVFRDTAPRSFWMRNTRIPLDIIFLKPDGQIDSIRSMKPFDISSTRSAGPAKYAIELNEGCAAKVGIKTGDVLRVPADARETDE